MLEAILDFANSRNIISKPGFESKNVRWALVFDSNGKFLEIVELGDLSSEKNPGKTFPLCPSFSQPEMIAGGEIKSHFLVDTVEVAALFTKKEADSKLMKKHDYFVNLLEQASSVYPILANVASSLRSDETLSIIRTNLEQRKAKPTDKITIRIGDEYIVENQKCLEWYEAFRKSRFGTDSGKSKKKMRCFATGDLVDCAKSHPKIKGLAGVGGMPTGDVLIGFDKDAFESYGLKQSENASMSEEAARAYATALSYLIQNYSRKLAEAIVSYWYKNELKDPSENMFDFIQYPEETQELDAQERAKRLLDSIRLGRRPDLAQNQYYALTLSGAAGRVMVRDWMEGSFEELVANVKAWFEDLSIVSRDGESIAPLPKFVALLASIVRDLNEAPPPSPLVSKMWRAAVKGELIPRTVLSSALERFRVSVIKDEPSKHAQVGLLKAYHVRKNRLFGGDEMGNLEPYLNEAHPAPAYQCGRLMAVFAGLQRSAMPGVGAGVVQRYYAAASTTPSLVLGRLARMAQFHLDKLDKGLAHWYEEKMSSIWGRLKDELPRTLTLEEQSLFALGYYQQIADMRRKKVVVEEPDGSETKEE